MIKRIYPRLNNNLLKKKKNITDWKIEVIFFNDEYVYNVILIGLDGLIKLEEDSLNLNKIFKLVSTMPMANF